ncbi:MAG: hypothetical protein FWC80_03505 [Firmicutes bacterium]|nr:hypothetical protein [Bacillota bacterium]
MTAILIVAGIVVGLLLAFILTMLLKMIFRRPASDEVATTEVAEEPAVAETPPPPPVIVTAPMVVATPVVADTQEEEIVQVELFSLSRYDLMDHIEAMRENTAKFVMTPSMKERSDESLPDYLLCGERCFAIAFERNDCVHNIAIRLYSDTANGLSERHNIDRASYLANEDWYNLTIDNTFKNKREVYAILNASYDYVCTKYGLLGEEEAKEEFTHIAKEVTSGGAVEEIEKATAAAEESYLKALEKFKAENYSDYTMTRREIVEDTKAIASKDITIVEKPLEPQMPVSLKHKTKTYAILYGTDKGVMMVAKLYDAYADRLAVRHPQIRRAKFPAGANWYYIPVDGAFDSKKSVYAVLNASYDFVLAKYGKPEDMVKAEKSIYNNVPERTAEDIKALEDIKAKYYTDLDRREIIEYSGKADNPDIDIIDRPMEPQLPVSLKYKGKTYAMLYGTEDGVVMIAKLDNAYVAELSKKHAGICKAKFPAGANWYFVPVGSGFKTKTAVYDVLSHAMTFSDSKTKKAPVKKAPYATKVATTPKTTATKKVAPKTATAPKTPRATPTKKVATAPKATPKKVVTAPKTTSAKKTTTTPKTTATKKAAPKVSTAKKPVPKK